MATDMNPLNIERILAAEIVRQGMKYREADEIRDGNVRAIAYNDTHWVEVVLYRHDLETCCYFGGYAVDDFIEVEVKEARARLSIRSEQPRDPTDNPIIV